MFDSIMKEAKRLWIFIAIALGAMMFDTDAAKYILFGVGCISTVMIFAHLVRKLLHPYVDLEKLYESATDFNKPSMPAAVVLCAFIYLVTTVLNVSVQFIK